MNKLNLTAVRNRQDRYLLDHYMNLHAALISVAVAVAGLAVASIFSCTGIPDAPLRWGMVAVTLLVTANVYLGLLVGGLLLPHGEPTVWDFLFPLLVGVSEFVTFGLLVVDQQSCAERSSAPLGKWLFSVAATCSLAVFAIHRANRHIDPSKRYSADVRPIAAAYKSRLRRDRMGASAVAVGASASGVLAVFCGWNSTVFRVAVLAGLATLLTIGVVVHQQTANKVHKSLRTALRRSARRRVAAHVRAGSRPSGPAG
ncbi:hypothetical protein ACWEIJ_37960 [Lentzea sp. NPDC004789]